MAIGPAARSWLMRFDYMGLINRVPISQTTLNILATRTSLSASELVGIMNVPAYLVMKAIGFLLVKPFQLSGGVVTDFMEAASYGTTIGGLRAYRITAGRLPGSMQALAGTAAAYIDIESPMSRALYGLRIKQMLDSTKTMSMGMLALHDFLNMLPATTGIMIVQSMGINYPLDYLLAIRRMSRAELLIEAQKQEQLAAKFELPPEVTAAFRGLWEAYQSFKTNLEIDFINMMTKREGNRPSLIEGLTELSKGLTHFTDFIVTLLKTFKPIIDGVYKIGLALWTTDRKKLIKAIEIFKDLLKLMVRTAAAIVQKFTGYVLPMKWYYPGRAKFMERTQVPGAVQVFRPGIRHPGAWRGPGPAPSRVPIFRPGAPPSKVPIFRPGVHRPGAVIRQVPIRRPGAVQRPSQVPPGKDRAGPVRTVTGEGGITGPTSIAELEKDPKTQAAIAEFQRQFPNVKDAKKQIYSLVRGESNMGRDMVQPRGQYAGYFQLGSNEAYGQMGLTKQQFAALPFHKQLEAYTKWVKRNDPDGTNTRDLGLFNAASARKWQTMPDSTVVYPAGSREANANAATWAAASNAGGAVTIGGIKRYYGRFDAGVMQEILRAGGAVKPAPALPPTKPPPAPGGKEYRDPITATDLGQGPGVYRSGEGAGGVAHTHQGQDIMAPAGSPIYAPLGGTIVKHSEHGTYQGDAVTTIRLDDGRYVRIMHHHLDPNLKPGDRVEAGQVLGKSGVANQVPHLHLELWSGEPGRSQLLDPAREFGWDKGHLPIGGAVVGKENDLRIPEEKPPAEKKPEVDISKDLEKLDTKKPEEKLEAIRELQMEADLPIKGKGKGNVPGKYKGNDAPGRDQESIGGSIFEALVKKYKTETIPTQGPRTQEQALAKLKQLLPVQAWSGSIAKYAKDFEARGVTIPAEVRANLTAAAHNTSGKLLSDPQLQAAIMRRDWNTVNKLIHDIPVQERKVHFQAAPVTDIPEYVVPSGDIAKNVGRRNLAVKILPDRSPLLDKSQFPTYVGPDGETSNYHHDSKGKTEKVKIINESDSDLHWATNLAEGTAPL
jgi:murein DD-endopeptidase MepM/ murein hydrolase activator NlpD